MEPTAPVKVKRRDLMDNIKSRINAGYTNNLRKNEKDLRDKVKFFEKKEATGELKDYMRPRYELAKELLSRISEFRPGQAAVAGPMATAMGAPMATDMAAPMAAPMVAPMATSTGFANAAPILNTFNPNLASKPRQKSKASLKLRKGTQAPNVSTSPIFNPPPASPPPLTIPSGRYDANGNFHVNAVPRPPVPDNVMSTVSNSPSKIFGLLKKGRSKTIKKRLSSPIVNEYLVEATKQFLPLPELYDPYTGRKFAAEEDPMPEIERAYNMLMDIYNKAQRKAATLRKRGSR